MGRGIRMATVERYPVDFDVIQKGEVLTWERIAELVGCYPDHATPEQLLSLKGKIERGLWRRDKEWTLRIRHGEIHVLTDTEAAVYNRRYFKSYLRRARRRNRHALAVDRSNMTDEERQAHEQSLLTQGRILVAINVARRKPELVGHERKTPSMLVGRTQESAEDLTGSEGKGKE